MAATSSKKGKKKGKTVDLSSFLADSSPQGKDGTSFVTVKQTTNWADAMDEEDEDDFSGPVQRIALPSAPRAAREEVDLTKVPDRPPFTAYVGNLSYDVDDEILENFFSKMKIDKVRLVTDQGRLKGYGYVEFVDKQSLVDALGLNNETLLARKIRIDVAGGANERSGFGDGERRHDSQITGEGDDDDDWRGSALNAARDRQANGFGGGPRHGGFDDRDGGPRGFGGSSAADDGPWSRSNVSSRGPEPRDSRPSAADDAGPWGRGNYNDRERDNGYGSRRSYNDRYEPARGYDDGPRRGGYDDGPRGGYDDRRGNYDDRRGGYNDRRGGYDDRRGGYDDRRSSYDDRRGGYDGRRSDYDDRPRRGGYDDGPRRGGYEDREEKPSGERRKLNLQPRSKPAETDTVKSDQSENQPQKPSVFGNARPVDTAAKEREIEERLNRQRSTEGESRRPVGNTSAGSSSFGSRDIRENVERRIYNGTEELKQESANSPPKQQEKSAETKPVKRADIFGAAKPVDTAAREREIEERLAHERKSTGRARLSSDEDGRRNTDRENIPPHREDKHHGPRKEKKERPLPQSIDEMPTFEPDRKAKDFAISNKYAGLLGDDDDTNSGGDEV